MPTPQVIITSEPDDSPVGYSVSVQAENIGSTDELVTLLLVLVERMTEVSTDSYVRLVDEVRRVAAREARTEAAP